MGLVDDITFISGYGFTIAVYAKSEKVDATVRLFLSMFIDTQLNISFHSTSVFLSIGKGPETLTCCRRDYLYPNCKCLSVVVDLCGC